MNFKKFRGGKAMNKVLAIICCVSCIGLVACGAATYESNKETDIQSASSVVTVEAQDSTASHSTSKTPSPSTSASTSASTTNTKSSLSEQSTEQIQTPVQEAEPETYEVEPYEVEIVEEQEMYATEACNLREGPSSDDYNKIGSLSKGEAVEVVGIVKQYKGNTVLWYQTSTGAYVNGAYISDSLPVQQQSTQQAAANQQSTSSTPAETPSQTEVPATQPSTSNEQEQQPTVSSDGIITTPGGAQYTSDGGIIIDGKVYHAGDVTPGGMIYGGYDPGH